MASRIVMSPRRGRTRHLPTNNARFSSGMAVNHLIGLNFLPFWQTPWFPFCHVVRILQCQDTRETGVRPRGCETMIRSELIQKIADDNPHLYQRDVERIVNTIFEEIIDAMARGDRVELRGFGAFSVKKRDARVGRNPRTGESVEVEEKHVPFFKTGKLLRDRLNGK